MRSIDAANEGVSDPGFTDAILKFTYIKINAPTVLEKSTYIKIKYTLHFQKCTYNFDKCTYIFRNCT